MKITEAQLRSVIRKMLLEFTPALKADAAWSDLTDGSGPMKGLLSGKTVAQAIKDLYGHLLELEPGELEDQYPELDASIITSGDDARALDHLRVAVTAVHAENEKDYDRDAVRQDLMYFATKSKRPELKALQQRVLDPKEPEYTIDSLAYEEDLKAILGKIEDEVDSLPDDEAKRIRNILAAEEDDDKGFARPRSADDFKGSDTETVPGVKEEGKKRKKKRKKRRKKKSKSQKMPPGYKAKKGTARGTRLRQLTKRYKDALKTPGKADDMAAIKARDAYEKTQKKSNRKSKYTEGEVMSEDVLRRLIQEIALDEKKKRKKRKKKRKSRKISSKVNDALKNKAKKHNAPLGALKAVYRKGMGAFYTSGSRPGQNPHSWSMARVNSFLKGGKARQVDATQWKQVQKHRARKRKKK